MNNYKNILVLIRDNLPNAQIFLMSYYPVNSNKFVGTPEEKAASIFATRTNEAINHANERLQALAEEYGCEYIDVNSILLDSEGNLDEKYTPEGIHLLPEAYEVILKALVSYF